MAPEGSPDRSRLGPGESNSHQAHGLEPQGIAIGFRHSMAKVVMRLNVPVDAVNRLYADVERGIHKFDSELPWQNFPPVSLIFPSHLQNPLRSSQAAI